MKSVTLKISALRWLCWFAILFLMLFAMLIMNYGGAQIGLIITVSLCGGAVTALASMGIFYSFHKNTVITNNLIIPIGAPHKRIMYDDIDEIKVGREGFEVIKGNHKIAISNIYSNYKAAKKILNEKIKKHQIELSGKEKYI
jgi:hypothetical protein